MGDNPVSEKDLKGAKLKTVTTNAASDEPDATLVANIKKQWAGSIEKTQSSAAYKGIKWNAKWVTQLKAVAAGEQADFFAKGVATGLAFAE